MLLQDLLALWDLQSTIACAYLSKLQIKAKRILDESKTEESAHVATNEEAVKEDGVHDQANNLCEGQLGLLPGLRAPFSPPIPAQTQHLASRE